MTPSPPAARAVGGQGRWLNKLQQAVGCGVDEDDVWISLPAMRSPAAAGVSWCGAPVGEATAGVKEC